MPNFDDPFIRGAAQCVAILVAIILSTPPVLGSLVAIDYHLWPEDSGNETLAAVFGFIPSAEAPRLKDLLGLLEVLIAAIPAAFIAVAVETKGNTARNLTLLGRGLAIVFAVAVLLAIFAYLTIAPDQWGSNHRLEKEGLQRLLDLVRGSLQASVFYLAVLFGLKAIK